MSTSGKDTVQKVSKMPSSVVPHVVESSPPLERVRESITAVARSLAAIFACLESLRRCRASQ